MFSTPDDVLARAPPPTTNPIETLPFVASMTVLKWISRVSPNIVPVNLKLLTKLWWILQRKRGCTAVLYVDFDVMSEIEN